MAETRKLAAIMGLDVVGYSRLMGEDEAGTARAVRENFDAIRPLVAGRGGRIVKTMGDGLLLEFPSVVDAVDCAIAIQKSMAERNLEIPEAKRIVFRIGVNLGDVLVDGGDILGESVNIAARLEAICEPGGVLVSGSAYDQVRGKVDAHFVDLGEKAMKNIARPVRAHAVEIGAASLAPALSPSEPNGHGPPHLSIVVMPFKNIGGDPEQEYFVDGVTESLTTDLSRLGGTFVIGWNTAFTYKGKGVDPKQIGQELNVRYVLEGSVQRTGGRMRVNVRLVDAESAGHLWAERFDKPIADLFDMQDEIIARLANALSVRLFAAEARRAERRPHPDSMDLCFQAWALSHERFTPDRIATSRDLFERAAARDPTNVFALVGVAATDFSAALNFFPDDRVARLAAAEAKLTRALFLAPDAAIAHFFLGVVQMHTNRAEQGVRQCERALQLDRNMAGAHAQIGNGKLHLGKAEETETHVLEALRLSPRDSQAYLWCVFAGMAKIHLGEDEDAVSWLRRSVESNKNFPSSHFLLAAALAHLGRPLEARSETRVGLEITPNFSISRVRASASSDNLTTAAGRERVIEGLRKAGVPEE